MFKTIAAAIAVSLSLNYGEQKPGPSAKPQSEIDEVLASVKNRDLDRVKKYLEDAGNINAKNQSEEFLLLTAVFNKQNEVAKFLLEKGADPNLTEMSGQSPAFVAS